METIFFIVALASLFYGLYTFFMLYKKAKLPKDIAAPICLLAFHTIFLEYLPFKPSK